MSDALILVERDGGIVTVVLNRPAKLNALDQADVGAARRNVPHALGRRQRALHPAARRGREVRSRPATTSRSSRPSVPTSSRRSPTGEVMHATAHALSECRHPIVAQIHGICVGGGLEIAALADLRICGASSRFGAPIKNLGLVMAYARDRRRWSTSSAAASRSRSCSRAGSSTRRKRRTRDSSRASCADDQVAAEARATAERIADGAPLVARWHKQFARRLRSAAPLTPAELESVSTASTPRTSASATRRSSPSRRQVRRPLSSPVRLPA